MKKSILVLLSVLTLALASFGWARSPHRGPDLQRLTDTLHLDRQQAEEVSQILQQQRAEREKLRTQMRADMQALHQDTLEQLGKVLSDEQLQKFTQLSEARHARHRRHTPEPMSPAPAQ